MMKMLKNPFFKNNLFLEYLSLLTEEDQYWLLYLKRIFLNYYYIIILYILCIKRHNHHNEHKLSPIPSIVWSTELTWRWTQRDTNLNNNLLSSCISVYVNICIDYDATATDACWYTAGLWKCCCCCGNCLRCRRSSMWKLTVAFTSKTKADTLGQRTSALACIWLHVRWLPDGVVVEWHSQRFQTAQEMIVSVICL